MRILKIIPVLIISGILLSGLTGCSEKGYQKPKDLIGKNKMADILYDLHLSQAMLERFRYNDPDSLKLNQNDLYQSVLDKYQVGDSTLALSIIYYSTYPKLYEEIYSKVMDRMNMEQEKMNNPEEVKVKE